MKSSGPVRPSAKPGGLSLEPAEIIVVPPLGRPAHLPSLFSDILHALYAIPVPRSFLASESTSMKLHQHAQNG